MPKLMFLDVKCFMGLKTKYIYILHYFFFVKLFQFTGPRVLLYFWDFPARRAQQMLQ